MDVPLTEKKKRRNVQKLEWDENNVAKVKEEKKELTEE